MVTIVPCPAPLLLARDQPAAGWRMDRDRALRRVRRGVYVPAAVWAALAPWERYLARVHAVAATWTRPVFCRESAAALIGLPLFGEPREVHVLGAERSNHRRGDVAVHGPLDGRAALDTGLLSVTPPVDTAVDLCRILSPAFALAVADATVRMLGGEPIPFAAHGRAQQNRRGLRRLEWVEARATSLAESPGESCSRAVIEWLGFEAPELQVSFRNEGRTDRVDFFWPRARRIGESDGYGKYRAADADATRDRLIAEKTREDRLRRHVGGVIRWDLADALEPSRLDAKLRAGGLRPVRARREAMLATLDVRRQR